MTMTSSYSNNADRLLKEEDQIVMDKYDRFHRMPVAQALGDTRDKIAECDRATGHVLVVKEKEGVTWIKCERCGAEWKSMGF